MTTRELPIAEWPKLAGTELETVWPVLEQLGGKVIVVEDDGVIVGCWSLMQIWHAEGVWIAPERRINGGVARRLWLGMRALAGSVGASRVITGAASDEVAALLEKHGAVQLPAREYILCLQ